MCAKLMAKVSARYSLFLTIDNHCGESAEKGGRVGQDCVGGAGQHFLQQGHLLPKRRGPGAPSSQKLRLQVLFHLSLNREGGYVKIFGSIRVFKEEKAVIGTHIKSIEKFDEVTNHFLQVFTAHCMRVQGPLSVLSL